LTGGYLRLYFPVTDNDFHLQLFEQLGLGLELAVEGLEHLTLFVDVLVRPPREGHGLARTVLIGDQAFHLCVYLSEVLLQAAQMVVDALQLFREFSLKAGE
jgi:hypothetical protein